MLERIKNPIDFVDIAVVGKYVELEDAYKSLKEALIHAGFNQDLQTRLHWVEAETLENIALKEKLQAYDGILVPGGFGERGILGKIQTIQYARENKVPFFGICLGMQCCVIEFARNVCGLNEANSTEFDPATPNRVIYKLRELRGIDDLGGTMRLGAYPCVLAPDSQAFAAYGKTEISERHRHRYEFNRDYEPLLTSKGLKIVGSSPDKNFVEVVEIADHPWFVGCQFHPEFKSKPLVPHPLFKAFIHASYKNRCLRQKGKTV
jgi:CTP synthase